MIIRKLKAIFHADQDRKLAEILGVKTVTLSEWYRKERSKPPWPLPSNIEGLLKLVHGQQEEIQRLRAKLEEKINDDSNI